MANPLPPHYPKIKLSGLHTDPNSLSSVPEGALLRAQNINLNAESVITGRRGVKNYGAVDVSDSKVHDFFEYQSTLHVHYDDKIGYDTDNAGNFSAYSGTFVQPSGGHLRGVEASRNVYINTSTGIKVLDDVGGTWRDAGTAKALGGTAEVGSTDSGYLANGESRDYQIVWTHTDANKNVKRGGVSEIITVSNGSGNPQYVDITFSIPSSITTANTFEIYRTKGDVYETELFLVYSRAPTSGEIVAGEVTYTDNTPDTQLGATLYTSADGVTQDNAQPPIAMDFVFFKNHMLYANTTGKHTFLLQYVGGLANDNGITIGGRTYTAKATENAGAQEFELTAGTTASDVEATVRSLIRVINADASASFYAYYNSNVQDPAGKILLQERAIGGDAFALTSDVEAAWLPNLPPSGDTVVSDNLRSVNALMWSKLQQPEAVPYANIMYLGSANHPIVRIMALRDFVLIFKTDGIWQLYGDAPAQIAAGISAWANKEFDLTVKNLIVSRSAVALTDKVVCFTDQGILEINGQGVNPISYPVTTDLDSLRNLSSFDSATFAVAYESDKKYMLFTVAEETDQNATHAYVYNDKTKTWVTHRYGEVSAAYVLSRNGKEQLYLGAVPDESNNASILQERKDFDRFDFADQDYEIVITAVDVGGDPLVITVEDATNVEVGNSIRQAGRVAQVVSIDGENLTLSRDTLWEVDDPEYPETAVYKAVPCLLEFTQLDLGSPSVEKTLDEIYLYFGEARFDSITVGFSNNQLPVDQYEEVTVLPTRVDGGWGLLPWGAGVWGGGPGGGQQIIRVEVPENARDGNWFNIRIEFGQAFTAMKFLGLSTQAFIGSERIQ